MKRFSPKVGIFFFLFLTLMACGESPNTGNTNLPEDTPSDSPRLPEGSIQIGKQIWMQNNLNVSTFRNGDPIRQVRNREEAQKMEQEKIPAWCYYENDSLHGQTYGRLYNWYAVQDPRGLAPEGWRIPLDADWDSLFAYLGNTALVHKLKSKEGWNKNRNGSDEVGFRALPSGVGYGQFSFMGYKEIASFWSADDYGRGGAGEVTLNYDLEKPYRPDKTASNLINKTNFSSVRCVRE